MEGTAALWTPGLDEQEEEYKMNKAYNFAGEGLCAWDTDL